MRIKQLIMLIGLGMGIGIINGLFGGGGGMLCVPALKCVGLQDRQAHATAIFVMLPISIASTVIYITSVGATLVPCLWVSIGSVVGGAVGACVLKGIKNDIVNLIFISVMLVAGVRMII